MANSRSLSQQASGEKSVETPSFEVEWENGIKDLEDFLEYNMEESINNLNTESQNILTRINNATIVSTNIGNEQDFID